MSLDELRQALDRIDNEVMSLLAQRASIIFQVADFKNQHGGPVHDPVREEAIIARLSDLNPGPLPAAAMGRIYRKIIEEMRNFEAVVHEAS
jgi:chorismate mutase/prephenate dehydratase